MVWKLSYMNLLKIIVFELFEHWTLIIDCVDYGFVVLNVDYVSFLYWFFLYGSQSSQVI